MFNGNITIFNRILRLFGYGMIWLHQKATARDRKYLAVLRVYLFGQETITGFLKKNNFKTNSNSRTIRLFRGLHMFTY